MDKNQSKGTNRIRISRFIYGLLAVLFFICIIVQVFLAGVGVFVSWEVFEFHRQLPRYIDPLLLTMFIITFIGQIKGKLRWFCLGFIALNSFQYLATVDALRGIWLFGALHPVSALIFFWGALFLMKKSWPWIVRY